MAREHTPEALLRGCDDAQIAAITTPASPVLVVAGAGAGKTRVLTRRIAWQARRGEATAGATLALTFTRKAAAELRDRLPELGLDEPVTTGTFHAVALAQLRQRALDLHRPLPVVSDSRARLVATVLAERAPSRGGRDIVPSVVAEIDWAKARLVRPERYPVEARRAGRTPALGADVVAEIFDLYERERTRRRVYDFDDLLTGLASLIERDPDFGAAQRWRFRHLYVDEYQDVNPAQLKLLDAWLGGRRDLYCVGDAKQAIFGWNGADPTAISRFRDRFAGSTVIELAANYRSTREIVRVASAVLSEPASTAPARDAGAVPTVRAYATELDEAVDLVRLATRLGRRTRFSDCAILARTNAQLTVFEQALETADVPYRTSAHDNFLARPAVRSALDELAAPSALDAAQAFRSWLGDLDLATRTTDARAADDLDVLRRVAEEFEALDPLPTAEGFSRYLAHSVRRDLLPHGTDAIDLLSFHRAKGLEWRYVFVAGIEDGLVPHYQATTPSARLEEERLLYVALSRAIDELHCSWARSRVFGRRRVTRAPSPFLASIERSIAEIASLRAPDHDHARREIAASRALLRRARER